MIRTVRELIGRQIVHDSQESDRLLLEKAIDGLGSRRIDKFGSFGKLAKNRICCPQEAS